MRLPKSVQQIADVIGKDKALRLVRKLRSQQDGKTLWLYVPRPYNLHDDHRLVALLGWEDALAMCKEFGGIHLYPSPCRYLERAMRNRQVLALRDMGLSIAEIAQELSLTTKWVGYLVEAREMHRSGIDMEVIAHSVKINPYTLGYILDVDFEGDIGPVKRRPRQTIPARERQPY